LQHEAQIETNTRDILALQANAQSSTANTAAIATLQGAVASNSTALALKLNTSDVPTRSSLQIESTNNTSDLKKPISILTQVALANLQSQLTDINTVAADSFYQNQMESVVFTPPTTAANPPLTQPGLTITTRSLFSKSIVASFPLVFFRDWFNVNSAAGSTNVWSINLVAVSFAVTRNGAAFATGTCETTDPLPKIFSVTKTVSSTRTLVSVYTTNVISTFLPLDTTGVYTITITPEFTDAMTNSTAAKTLGKGFILNSTLSGFTASTGGSLTSGSVGSSFASQNYTLATSVVYPDQSDLEFNVDTITTTNLNASSILANTMLPLRLLLHLRVGAGSLMLNRRISTTCTILYAHCQMRVNLMTSLSLHRITNWSYFIMPIMQMLIIRQQTIHGLERII
jgi:hypothetical protein